MRRSLICAFIDDVRDNHPLWGPAGAIVLAASFAEIVSSVSGRDYNRGLEAYQLHDPNLEEVCTGNYVPRNNLPGRFNNSLDFIYGD